MRKPGRLVKFQVSDCPSGAIERHRFGESKLNAYFMPIGASKEVDITVSREWTDILPVQNYVDWPLQITFFILKIDCAEFRVRRE